MSKWAMSEWAMSEWANSQLWIFTSWTKNCWMPLHSEFKIVESQCIPDTKFWITFASCIKICWMPLHTEQRSVVCICFQKRKLLNAFSLRIKYCESHCITDTNLCNTFASWIKNLFECLCILNTRIGNWLFVFSSDWFLICEQKSERAKERFACEKEWIPPVALLSCKPEPRWTGGNR